MLKIENIKFENFGQFKELEMSFAPLVRDDFHSNITVLIGNNGSGKTSVLNGIATSLSWFIARIRNEKGNGNIISEEAILNESNTASIAIEVAVHQPTYVVEHFSYLYKWEITKTRKGALVEKNSSLQELSLLVKNYKDGEFKFSESNFPLIVFYPVERSVLDIPLKIKNKHKFDKIDAYDNALKQGVDFRRFFEWFRYREDIENEQFREHIDNGNNEWRDIQLDAVRKAISIFMPELSSLKVKRKPKLHMSVKKNGKELNVSQLSQGEKSLMALVGDIARRLAILNPDREEPLLGDGVILIDEIDMHLHPSWQRKIISKLGSTFPNCQFILTTHSPLIISDSKNVLLYELNNQEIKKIKPQYGQDVNSVLNSVMNTAYRNEDVEMELNRLLEYIQNNNLEQAKALLAHLENDLKDNIEILKSKLILRKMELKNEKNN